MKLEIASAKAIRFACMNFHYARAVPSCSLAFSVFNDAGEWCGVIAYGLGATPNIGSPYGLSQGHVFELVRMALNGKQKSASKCMAISLRMIAKKMPLVKLVVSFADIDQDHVGVIYQAANWYYVGECNKNVRTGFFINGKKTHNKSLHSMGKRQTLQGAREIDPSATEFISAGKHKYIYPLHKSLIPLCKSLSKPYPKKNASEVHAVERLVTNEKEGGSNPTQTL